MIGFMLIDKFELVNTEWFKEGEVRGFSSVLDMFNSLQKKEIRQLILSIEDHNGIKEVNKKFITQTDNIEIIEEIIVFRRYKMVGEIKDAETKFLASDSKTYQSNKETIQRTLSKVVLISFEDPELAFQYWKEEKLPKETILLIPDNIETKGKMIGKEQKERFLKIQIGS